MEEMYWKQFWKTGKLTDYLTYRNSYGKDKAQNSISGNVADLESEETIESDYSDGNGFTGITYR